MATIQGTGGNVTIAGYNGKMVSWTANFNVETADTTGFTSSGFGEVEPVICSVEGSATAIAQYDATNTAPAPTLSGLPSASPVAVVLTMQSGNTWSFSAVVSRVSMTRPVDGKMDLTFDFQSDGAVTQSWA